MILEYLTILLSANDDDISSKVLNSLRSYGKMRAPILETMPLMDKLFELLNVFNNQTINAIEVDFEFLFTIGIEILGISLCSNIQ
jgi:hypothetical protein